MSQSTTTGPRVRLLRRVVVHVGSDGVLDLGQARRAADGVRPGDDVVLVIRGRLGYEPAVADLLGQALAECRTISIEADGPGADVFAATLATSAARAGSLLP